MHRLTRCSKAFRDLVHNMSASSTITGTQLDTISLVEPAFWRRTDRDQVFEQFRQLAPIWWHPDSDSVKGFWSLTRHAEVDWVSRNWKTFCSGLGTSITDEPVELSRALGGMLNMDAPEHVRLRKIVNHAFAPRAMQAMANSIDDCARQTISAIAEQGECDFATEIAQPFPVKVICQMLGAPSSDWRELHRLSTVALGADGLDIAEGDETREQVALDAFYALNRYGEDMCASRRKQPRDDLISAIATAQVDGDRLSDEEVGVFFQLLITAGVETTGTAIGQGFLALSQFPDERRRWQADFERLAPSAVEEVVRYSTPVIHFRRTATRDIELDGVAISEGDKVVLWYLSANRDESVFVEPFKLDLARQPNPHLGYGGGGRHFCLGANLARLEITALFKYLFEYLPDIEVSGEETPLPSRFVNGLLSLPCRYTPSSRTDL